MAARAALLCWVAVPAAGFSFLSIGDWGDSDAKKVAGHMGQYSPDFVLAIGDNFYSRGVSGVDDPQFQDKFEDTFTAPSLQDIPWYVCAGNHDYYGGQKGIAAEMEYTNHSSRWTYPSLYFARDVSDKKTGVTVKVLSVDTWRLNGGDTFVMYDAARNVGALRGSPAELHAAVGAGRIPPETRDLILASWPLTGAASAADAEQLAWLNRTLAASTADWNVVIGHFPVHSATTGEHGDTPMLKTVLAPLLERHAANTVYFSGHDHVLQHIQAGGVNYLGSGAGAQKHTGMNADYAGLKGHHDGHFGFMSHTVTKTSLSVQFVDDTGARPYNFTIAKA